MQEIPSVAGELLAMMSGDWDRRAVEADVVWLALHLARYTHTYIHCMNVTGLVWEATTCIFVCPLIYSIIICYFLVQRSS